MTRGRALLSEQNRARKKQDRKVSEFPNRLLLDIYSAVHSSIMCWLRSHAAVIHDDGLLSSVSADLVSSVAPSNLLEFVPPFRVAEEVWSSSLSEVSD